MRNKYNREDRIIAFTLYKTGEDSIGFFDIKKIAQITGHSVDSYKMKIDQFKGIAGPRKKVFIDGDIGPGLNEWADADQKVWDEYKDTDSLSLVFLAKMILKERFAEFQSFGYKVKRN